MLDKIKAGQKVHIKVTRKVTNAAAVKTLARLLTKDAGHKENIKRVYRVKKKAYEPRPRGGRFYGGHLVISKDITGKLGEEGTIKATLDVLKDLKSVERFIEIKAA